MHTSFDRTFNELFNMFGTVLTDTVKPSSIPVDIEEKEKEFILTADVPGYAKKDINVSVDNGVLKISVEKKPKKKEETDRYRYNERNSGSFNRSFTLSDNIDIESISGACENGVLTVTLPKKEADLPRDIPIK